MRGMGSATLRGGQTVLHGLRMWGQLLQVTMWLSVMLVVAVPAWNLWRTTDGAQWYAVGVLTMAEAKLAIGYKADARQDVRLGDGRTSALTLYEIVGSRRAIEAREAILGEILSSAFLGAELVSAKDLRKRILPLRSRALQAFAVSAWRPYCIANIPYPERTETQHTIVSGTTGSGKTVLIADLVSQIRAKGERCVIYDKMGSYTRAFFDPERDVLLNPLDARSPRWSPFYEADSPRDFDMMASALIPQQKDTVDPFWVTAARQLFANGATVLWRKGERRNRVLVGNLLKTKLEELARAMEGTVGQSIIDVENPKTALSVRAMLTAHLGAMEFLPDTGTPFSIRQ